jgi:orotate phosphoribosyltransferase
MLLLITTGGKLDEGGDCVGDGGAGVAGYFVVVQRQDICQIMNINRGVKAHSLINATGRIKAAGFHSFDLLAA